MASGLRRRPPRRPPARRPAPGDFQPRPREGRTRGEDGDVEHRTATFQRVRRRVRPTTREVRTRGVFRPNGREDALFRHRLCRRARGKRTRGGGGGGSSERGRGVDKRTDDRGAKTPSRRRLGRFRRRGRVRWCGREGERDTSRRERARRSRVRFDPPRDSPPPGFGERRLHRSRRRGRLVVADRAATRHRTAAPGVSTFGGVLRSKASPPSWRRRVVRARRGVATTARVVGEACASPRPTRSPARSSAAPDASVRVTRRRSRVTVARR